MVVSVKKNKSSIGGGHSGIGGGYSERLGRGVWHASCLLPAGTFGDMFLSVGIVERG